jgi:hypothetical protein
MQCSAGSSGGGCGQSLAQGAPFFGCKPCKATLCEACFRSPPSNGSSGGGSSFFGSSIYMDTGPGGGGNSNEPAAEAAAVATCSGGHGLKHYNAPNDALSCDRCKKVLQKGNPFHGCKVKEELTRLEVASQRLFCVCFFRRRFSDFPCFTCACAFAPFLLPRRRASVAFAQAATKKAVRASLPHASSILGANTQELVYGTNQAAPPFLFSLFVFTYTIILVGWFSFKQF